MPVKEDSMNLVQLGNLLILLDGLPNEITVIKTRLLALEARMTSVEDVITRVEAFTTQLGDDVTAVARLIRDLQSAVETGRIEAINEAMSSLAPSISRMEEIGKQLHDTATGNPTDPLST